MTGWMGLTRSAAMMRPPAAGSVSPNWAIAASIFSNLTQAYAGFTAARLAQYDLKAQSSEYAFRSQMLELDRRAAERQAQSILRQGESQIAQLGMEAEQRRAATAVTEGTAGIESGTGSSLEVQQSNQIVDAIDRYHIDLGAVRAANAARSGATRLENEALMARTSARNLRRSARVAAPEGAIIGGLASSAIDWSRIVNYRGA